MDEEVPVSVELHEPLSILSAGLQNLADRSPYGVRGRPLPACSYTFSNRRPMSSQHEFASNKSASRSTRNAYLKSGGSENAYPLSGAVNS
jgi:hypothetical protein